MIMIITVETFGGGGQIDLLPRFYGFKILLLDQKLWYSCSLFVNTSFDTNEMTSQVMTSSEKVTQFVC